MTITLLEGNCLEILKTLPACSVQCVVTSPPYYGLRDYGMDGQIGLEETPEAYVENLISIFREVRRVLEDDGTVWLNLGDSYAGSQQTGGTNSKSGIGKTQPHINRAKDRSTAKWAYSRTRVGNSIKPKDLIGIPWMVAFALRTDGWYLRQDIIWAKPNPMPESVADRCTKSHEYIFLLSKRAQYYYNAEAIAELSKWAARDSRAAGNGKHKSNGKSLFSQYSIDGVSYGKPKENGLFYKNKRDVWTVSTKPYREAHFATFPPDLIEPCILAGSKEGDTVLDPFNGSGTTGAVAIKHHRYYIGCELNPKYIELTKRRFSRVQLTFSEQEQP